MVISILLLVFSGLNLGIDFEGGTSWQVQTAKGVDPKVADVRAILDPLGFSDAKVSTLAGQSGKSIRVQAETVPDPVRKISRSLAAYAGVREAEVLFEEAGTGGTFTFDAGNGHTLTEAGVTEALKKGGVTVDENTTVTVSGNSATVTMKTVPVSPVVAVSEALAKYAGVKPGDVTVSTVGPTWGHDVSNKSVKALIVFFILLAVYLTVRFEWKMSVAAIVAVIHDIIFTVGVYALLNALRTRFEVTPATITAFLTILGFSLYDTVVVFDKVIENQRALTASGKMTYGEMVNKSLNTVLMRSLSTTVVAVLPVASLLIVGSFALGAVALEDFALALAAGLFIGAYSSIFVAAPLLAWWKEKEPQYRNLADRRRRVSLAAASASTGVAVVHPDEAPERPLGIPGPPAVPRTITPRPRQQRRRKR